MMKINKWLLVALICVSAFSFLQSYRSCKAYDELSVMEGKYQEQVAITEINKKESDARIAALEEKQDELNGMIDSYNTVIVNKQEEIDKKNGKIINLNEKLKNAQSDAERVVILTQQVQLLSENFSLCQDQLAEKDKIIFALTQKYTSQLKISDELRGQLGSQIDLNKTCQELKGELEGKIVHLQKQSNLKTYFGLGLLAVLVLSFAK